MGAEHGSCSSSNANHRKALMPLISVLTEFEQEGESSRQPRVNQETTNTITLGPGKKLKSSAYVSSSLSESSSEDLLQMNLKVTSKSSVKPLLRGDKIDTSSDTSSKSELDSGSTDATSPVSDLTHESMLQNMSPTQSPPMQMMERPRDYDPSRIPESVFDSKSPMPMEWSVASTESLFSIHLGNNSFSREHVHMMGGDLHKSGELNKSRELYKPGETNKSPELMRFKPAPPVAVVGKSERKGTDVARKNGATKVFDENSNYDPSEADDDQSEEKLPHPDVSWDSSNTNQRSDRSATTHNRSDESGLSTQSFPFPMPQIQKKKKKKKTKSAWPKCNCSNCSWAFCYCTWPSCYCKWPRCYCSNCSWAFCYFWNCKRQRLCCYSSSDVLTDEGMSISAKRNHKQQQHSQPKKASKKWYSCLCCFSKGCCSWSCSKSCRSWSCSKCCRFWSCSNWCPWSWSNCCSWLSCSNYCSSWSCSNCCSWSKWCSCCSCSKCSSFWSCSNCFSSLSCSKCFSCLSCSKCRSCLSCSKCCSCWSRK